MYKAPICGVKRYSKRPLDKKRQTFVAAYIEHGDVAKAAAEAGYSQTQARRLLNNNIVSLAINNSLRAAARKATARIEATVDYKVSTLVDIIGRGKDADVNTSHVLSAISELNKMTGDYAPDKSVNVNLTADMQQAKEIMDKIKERERGF